MNLDSSSTHVDSNRHFLQGGLGITNFDKNQTNIYHEAIRRSGHDEILYVDSRAIEITDESAHSLRFRSKAAHQYVKDLGQFWKIFYEVKQEHEDIAALNKALDELAIAQKNVSVALSKFKIIVVIV